MGITEFEVQALYAMGILAVVTFTIIIGLFLMEELKAYRRGHSV